MPFWKKRVPSPLPSRMMTVAEAEFAPAKINLALHVTGRRNDGYHDLDSLVVFANTGDWVRVAPSETLSLSVVGPFAEGLPTDDTNLVLRAAKLLGQGRGATIALEKNLPLASGIGGGSADAAAALKALSRLWRVSLPDKEQVLKLGADLPVCMLGQPARMQGVGDILTPVEMPRPLHMVLINPGVEISTPDIFRHLKTRNNEPLPEISKFKSIEDVAKYITLCRNDLEAPAFEIAPVIRDVITQIEATENCFLARMSGSGATCFGLYPDAISKDRALSVLKANNPKWWVAS